MNKRNHDHDEYANQKSTSVITTAIFLFSQN